MAGILSSVLLDGKDDRPNFLRYWEYVQLRRLLDRFVADGRVRKIVPFKPLYPGCSEEWFLDPETGEIYCLVPGGDRIECSWEKIDIREVNDSSASN